MTRFLTFVALAALTAPLHAEDLAMDMGEDTHVTEEGTLNPHEMSMARAMHSCPPGSATMSMSNHRVSPLSGRRMDLRRVAGASALPAVGKSNRRAGGQVRTLASSSSSDRLR